MAYQPYLRTFRALPSFEAIHIQIIAQKTHTSNITTVIDMCECNLSTNEPKQIYKKKKDEVKDNKIKRNKIGRNKTNN